MKYLLGKKLEMTQIWQNGETVAVTKVQAGPCTVVQVKNGERDGYSAVQIGFGKKREGNIAKPQKGHIKGLDNFRYLKEFRPKTEEKTDLKRGDVIDVSTFEPGDTVDVIGVSKGKGFQGIVKRYGFHGQDKTHGNKDQLRMSGSIGSTGPAHVFKGTRMGGRTGGDRVTTKNLVIADIDIDNGILFIKGAVPGARNGLVMISGQGDLKIRTEEKKTEEAIEEAEVKEVETPESSQETVETPASENTEKSENEAKPEAVPEKTDKVDPEEKKEENKK